jgi:hypothetical protein
MAAFDNATVTIDTDEMVYTNNSGTTHTVNNAQTFVCSLAADGTDAVYTILTDTLTCTDGTVLEIELDPVFSSFRVTADATANTYPSAGTITFRDPDDNSKAIWDIRTVTIDDIDEPTDITEMILERRDNTLTTMSLATITVAQ